MPPFAECWIDGWNSMSSFNRKLQTSFVMTTTRTRSGEEPATVTMSTTESCGRLLRLRIASSERTCRYRSPSRRSISRRTMEGRVVA